MKRTFISPFPQPKQSPPGASHLLITLFNHWRSAHRGPNTLSKLSLTFLLEDYQIWTRVWGKAGKKLVCNGFKCISNGKNKRFFFIAPVWRNSDKAHSGQREKLRAYWKATQLLAKSDTCQFNEQLQRHRVFARQMGRRVWKYLKTPNKTPPPTTTSVPSLQKLYQTLSERERDKQAWRITLVTACKIQL